MLVQETGERKTLYEFLGLIFVHSYYVCRTSSDQVLVNHLPLFGIRSLQSKSKNPTRIKCVEAELYEKTKRAIALSEAEGYTDVMKAVRVNDYGGADKLQIVDIASPVPVEGQTLVRVRAVSVNPFDIKLIGGAMREMIPLSFPITVGGDFAGKNEGTGEEVYGTATMLGAGSGSFAEMAVVNKNKFALRPKNITFEEAAALPLAGVSAMQAVIDEIKLLNGQKILIHGGAGGIGHIAIQIAKNLGAFVATTVSAKDMHFVNELGANLVIDYENQKFEDNVHDYDAVFDTVGGETLERSLGIIKEGGIIVSMIGKGEGVLSQKTEVNTESLNKLTLLVEKGKVKPHITVFNLDKVRDAWTLQSSHTPGKVVVKI